jgi:hypothetical protein
MKKTLLAIATIAIVIMLFNICNLKPTVKADTTANIQLTITGLVEHPLNLSSAEVAAMPKTTIRATIFCVDFPGVTVEEGNWTGIQLRTLLETAAIMPGAVKIGFYAKDEYSTDLTVDAAMRNDIILAYQKDGQTLSDLRLVVPDKWGYKWINQVTNIEVLNYDYLGFWESKGYSDEAEISQGQQKPIGPNSFPKPSSNQTAPPNPTPTNPSSTSPNPAPSQQLAPGALQQPTGTQTSAQASLVPTEIIFTAAIGIMASVAIAALMVRRKAKR